MEIYNMVLEEVKERKEVKEHIEKMKSILKQIDSAKSEQRKRQLLKCYHRLEKELAIYLNYTCSDIYVRR